MASFKWVRQKDDVLALKPKMESSKNSLSIVMHSLSLEALYHQPATAERDKEM